MSDGRCESRSYMYYLAYDQVLVKLPSTAWMKSQQLSLINTFV
jgi:hypothetical protein